MKDSIKYQRFWRKSWEKFKSQFSPWLPCKHSWRYPRPVGFVGIWEGRTHDIIELNLCTHCGEVDARTLIDVGSTKGVEVSNFDGAMFGTKSRKVRHRRVQFTTPLGVGSYTIQKLRSWRKKSMMSLWDFLGIDPGIFETSLDMEKANTGQFPDYIEVGPLDLKVFGLPIVVNPELKPGTFELKTYPLTIKEAVNG